MSTNGSLKDGNGLLSLSSRTVRKILNRANKNICSVCEWDKDSCDIHHIVPRHKGGTNELSNLIVLCPNCHRMAHSNKLDFNGFKSLVDFDFSSYYKPERCKRNKSIKDRPTKIKLVIDHEKLISMIPNTTFTNMAKLFGCSDKGLKKYCKRNNIDLTKSPYLKSKKLVG